jgi:hypothetical protein
MWGFWQSAHWRPNAGLYRSDWSEKPALTAYQDLVFDAWWTDVMGLSDEAGEYILRGFKGEYDITVEVNGVQYVLPLTLDDNENITFTLPLAPGPAGDYNDDGTVDAADFVVWRDGGPLLNETASPGVVDQADFDAWRANFGATAGQGARTAAIPEPAGLLLAALSAALLLAYRPARS